MKNGDRKRFKKAAEKWERLYTAGEFSVPQEVGYVAILCSSYTCDKDRDEAKKVRESFVEEAEYLKEQYAQNGKTAEIFHNARRSDMHNVLKEKQFSDIIAIGNGTFSSFFSSSYTFGAVELPTSNITWREISDWSEHLKLGEFHQRHCGRFTNRASVPLGLFAVSDHTKIYASPGTFFFPALDDLSDGGKFRQVTDEQLLSYESIIARFPQQPPDTNT